MGGDVNNYQKVKVLAESSISDRGARGERDCGGGGGDLQQSDPLSYSTRVCFTHI